MHGVGFPRCKTKRLAIQAIPKANWSAPPGPKLSDEILRNPARKRRDARLSSAAIVLFDVGQENYDFIYIECGAVEVIDRTGDHVIICIQAGNFIGELGMLMGQKTFLAAVNFARTDQAIVVPQAKLRELVATVPEISRRHRDRVRRATAFVDGMERRRLSYRRRRRRAVRFKIARICDAQPNPPSLG